MKDFLGNTLDIGDNVVFVQLNYRNFYKGVIEKITDKTLLIKHEEDNLGRKFTKQAHNQVIKI